MFSSNRRSTKRQSSKRIDKQRQQTVLGRLKPGLSLDTNFSRHIARPPQQVFPTRTRGCEQQDGNKLTAHLDVNGISPGDRLIPIGLAVPHYNEQLGSRHGNDSEESVATPTIVVTPAYEAFDQPAQNSPPKRRIPSSVYSRYTDVVPKSAEYEKTPPVPPLPFSIPQPIRRVGLGPFMSTSIKKLHVRPTQVTSVCTVFEEEASPAQRAVSAGTPSARHSKGWWNLITSPFSAQSTTFAWRSPTEEDRTPILQDSRAIRSEDELHSAPASVHSVAVSLTQSRRSMTAPSVLSTTSDGVDIYHIPSCGEAAAYYDPSRHFPSLIISSSDDLPRSEFEDDTPATSVTRSRIFSDTAPPVPLLPADLAGAHAENLEGEKPRTLFTSPLAEELRTPVPKRYLPDEKHTTSTGSQFSPLSPSPIVAQAHIAHVMGPADVEKKEIKTPSPPTRSGPALGAATMTSRSPSMTGGLGPQQARSLGHSRTSSYGLGITGSEVELFPPPPTCEKQAEEQERSPKGLPWYRRFLWPILALGTILLTLMVVLLVMHVPQHHSDIAVQAQWVNLTGYPPLPTGISTIAQPKKIREEGGCASPGLWSCSIASALNHTSSPNFRFEVRFRNDTALNASATQAQHRRRSSGAVLLSRDTWSDTVYAAKPAAPSTADQIFLGNTTDNNTLPYDGEATPFYISLLDAEALVSNLRKRQYPYPTDDTAGNTTTATTNNGPQSIPKALTNSDGTPLATSLYPLAESQPLRLYKRGRADEHYGFYTYYDKTIYISNGTSATYISNTALANTTAVCTWSQSRFLVQIWTRGIVATLAGNASSTAASSSSANNLSFPGSFPYAATITIDRHGGDASSKGVYCYGVGVNARLMQDVKTWMHEDRGHGGSLVNPAAEPSQHTKRETSAYGGVDGGTGGCACAWQNW